MSHVDRVLARIRAFRETRGWSPHRLALAAGLSENALRRMDDADWSPTVDTVRRIEALIPRDFTPGKRDQEAA